MEIWISTKKNYKQFYNINSKVTYHLFGVFLLDVYPLLAKKGKLHEEKEEEKNPHGLEVLLPSDKIYFTTTRK